MSGKNRGYAFDIDAWVQFHLLRLASHHAKTTKADVAVLAEIIQRYWGKYGNGWATHLQLGETAGISKSTVIRAKRNLERLGFITVVQAGRRGSATVYRPNFDLVPRKGVIADTQTKGVSDDTETADLGSTDDTETPEYGITHATPSYLQDRPTRAGSLIDRNECAAPTAPPGPGLDGRPGADTAHDGFDELWKAYNYKRGKAEARRAYEKLAPNADRHAEMIASAVAWRDTWAAQNKPDAPRYTLAKWIDREEFDCAPPSSYQPKQRKPKEAPKPKAGNDNKPPRLHGTVSIVDTKVDGPAGMTRLAITFDNGTSHTMFLEHSDYTIQQRGQREFNSLIRAAGLDAVEDASELHFAVVNITTTKDGELQFSPAAQEAA